MEQTVLKEKKQKIEQDITSLGGALFRFLPFDPA